MTTYITLGAADFLGSPLIDAERLGETLVRLVLNAVATLAIVLGVYRRSSSRGSGELVFTMVSLNVIVFLLTQLMVRVELSVGVGFGLFALFGMIRYRTDELTPREMTYVFAAIATAVANGMGGGLAWAEVIATNLVLFGTIWILERVWAPRQPSDTGLVYERIDLVHPARRDELIADLRERTGLEVFDVDISRRSFLNDTANVRMYYKPARGRDDSVGDDTAPSDA